MRRRFLPILFLCSTLSALPNGASVEHGDVSMQTIDNHLEVTASHQAIVNWQNFSIEQGAAVQFVQPSSDSVIVNRVVGQTRSEIMGNLEANGQVYLLNPHGILIGPHAVIDTGAFIASTLDAASEEFFRNGEIAFKGMSQESVVNLGVIKARTGDAIIMAYRVENKGTIDAASGLAALASGQEIVIRPIGEERILIRPSPAAGIDHTGRIAALRVELKAAGSLYALAINQGGAVYATTVVREGGRIRLAAEGNIAVTGTTEGSAIAMRGADIHFSENSLTVAHQIDAYATKTLLVDKGARLNADGVETGGRIVLWSDEWTSYEGEASLRGIVGGFMEVSSHGILGYNGTADLRGSSGKNGFLLFDPDHINVISTGTDPATGQTFSTGGTQNISGVSIAVALLVANVTLQANDDITITDSIASVTTTGNTLTFEAGGKIDFNSGTITLTDDPLIMVSNSTAALTHTADPSGSNFTMLSGTAIATGAGSLTITADSGTTGDPSAIIINSGATITSGVTVLSAVNAGSGQNGITLAGSLISDNTIALTGSTTGIGRFGISLPSGATLQSTGGTIGFSGSSQIGANITTNGFNISFDASSPITLSGDVTISTTVGTGAITFDSTIDGNQALNLTASAGVITLGGALGSTTPLSSLSAATAAPVLIGANISTQGSAGVSINAPVGLIGDSTIDTSANSAAPITFQSTIDGGTNLVLNAGSATGGTVSLFNQIGFAVPLTSLTVRGNALAMGVGGNGLVVTNGAGGISLFAPTTLAADTAFVSQALGDVTVANTIDGAVNLTLQTTNNSVNIQAAIGSLTPVTSLTVNSPSGQLGAAITAGVGGVSFTVTALTLTADSSVDTQLAGSGISFSGTIDGNKSLALSTGGGILSLGGNIGAITPLSGFSASSTFNFNLGVNITTQGAGGITLNLPITLVNAITLESTGTNGSIIFGNIVDGAEPLIVSALAGSISFDASVGSITPLTNLTVATGSGLGDVINVTSSMATSGFQTYNGAVILSGTASMSTTAGDVTFASTLDGAIAFAIFPTGSVIFDGAVGSTTPLTSLFAAPTNQILIASNVTTTGFQTYSSPVILEGNAAFASLGGGNISIPVSIDGNFSLTTNPTAGVVSLKEAGQTTPLSALRLNGSTIRINGNINTQGAGQSYLAPLEISQPVVLTDTGFSGIFISQGVTGAANLTMVASGSGGSIHVAGLTSLKATGAAGFSLMATANSALVFSGDISVSGSPGFSGGSVLLRSTNGGISVQNIDASGPGAASGSITLQPSTALSNRIPVGILTLGGNLTAQGSIDGTISLAALGRSELPLTASIASTSSGNDVRVQGGIIVMGPFETMTVLGNVNLDASIIATIGDVIGTNSVSITTPTLIIHLYQPSTILNNLGQLYLSLGAHIYSAGTITSPTPTGSGSGAQAVVQQLTSLTPASFTELLLLNDPTILNFYNSPSPPSPVLTRALLGKSALLVCEGFYQIEYALYRLEDLYDLTFSDTLPFVPIRKAIVRKKPHEKIRVKRL